MLRKELIQFFVFSPGRENGKDCALLEKFHFESWKINGDLQK